MKQTHRKLLQRLVAGQPRPTRKALSEFFVELKKHSVEDLMRMCGEALDGAPPKASSPLLVATKKRLREFGGKATDFLPYVLDAAASQVTLDRTQLGKSPTLALVIGLLEAKLGAQNAERTTNVAFETYAKAHDVSYKLKQG